MNIRKKTLTLSLSVLLLLSLVTGCGTSSSTAVSGSIASNQTEKAPSQPAATVPETESETEPEPSTEYIAPVTANIVAVGDMLMHGGVSVPAVQADGTYNYDYVFANVKDAVNAADLAIANNEVIMGGNSIGNIGYPCFNVRTELGDAEAAAGFDVILGATNHTMDQGAAGIMNCIDFWKTNHPDISLIGIHDSAESASEITVREVNGIRIAMLNYTYGLNGFELPQGYEYAADLMNEWTKSKIADDISRAKAISDFVIVFPHWGTEYNLGISDEQASWAQFFADNGVNMVIGTHPHVVEPVEWVTSSDGSNKMLVYYSLGNYISIQYYNFSMLGGMAQVSITKDSSGTYISDYGMKFLVTHYNSSRSHVTTYFLDDYTDELASSHAILTEPSEKYMAVNRSYPFTVEGLKSLAGSVCPDLVD